MRPSLLVLLLAGCAPPAEDRDGDGVPAHRDCDDRDRTIHPRAEDLVGDGIDSNCDGIDGVDADGDQWASFESGGLDCDDADPTSIGTDADGDWYGDCVDCDDGDPTVHPEAEELCDDLDQDCDGEPDLDPEGVGVCSLHITAEGDVDVLFVIDNSCSMIEEQLLLAASAHVLTDVLLNSGFSYHVGVVSTDMNDNSQSGKLVEVDGLRWVDPTLPNRDLVLNTMLQLGVDGAAQERGRDAAYAALETHGAGYNLGFPRNQAALDIIVLSDEDDHSIGSRQEFVDWMRTHRDGPVAFHSLVSPIPVCPEAAESGDEYRAVTNSVGGIFWSICDGNYQDPMAQIAELHDPAGRQSFTLPQLDPDSLAAEVLAQDGTLWRYHAHAELEWGPTWRRVTLPEPVPAGGSVRFWYRAPAAE